MYTNNKHVDTKMKNRVLFTNDEKQRYLDIIPTKYIQDLFTESYTVLIKEIKEDLNKQRIETTL